MSHRSPFAILAFAAAALAAGSAQAATIRVLVGPGDTQTFSPRNVTIRVGDTVEWANENAGGMFHNVVADDSSFTSGSPAAGPWLYRRTFTAVGTVGYYCAPHGGPVGVGMAGTILVQDSIELAHGSDMNEDLAGTSDRYRIGQRPYSSYEVVVDPLAGNAQLQLDRVDATGTAVIQTGDPVTAVIDMSQSLRWENSSASAQDTERVRVSSSSCPTNCTANDAYRVRAYETTLAIPRFNQSGSQVSIVILQNPTNYTIAGRVYFWSAAGALLNANGQSFSLTAKQALVLGAGAVAGVPGTSGTVTVTHNGRYGDLTGKVVALEPSTGFSFDSPAIARAR